MSSPESAENPQPFEAGPTQPNSPPPNPEQPPAAPPSYPYPAQPYPQTPQPGYPSPSQPYPPAYQPGYPPPSQPYPPAYQPGYPPPSQPYPQGYPQPSQPYPQYPAGQPSAPYPPGTPSQPYSGYPQGVYLPGVDQPGMSQPFYGQPTPWPLGPDGQPLAPAVAPVTTSSWGQLWPFWAWLVGGAVLLVIAVLAFFAGSDWAAGARYAGLTLIVGGVLVAATLGIRAAGGLFAATNTRRSAQITGTSIAAVVLLLIAGSGFALQSPIHLAQARSLESAKNYAAAINEYQLGGAGSADLARAYNEWGEQFNADGQYQTAIQKFETVINSYSDASDQVTRAKSGEATAYENLGERALNAQDYAGAVNYFQTLTTKFPSSSQAHAAHGDYAKALYGLGQSQLQAGGNSGCSSALTTYQQLVSDFSDTPQGTQAAAAIKAPQPVLGTITGSGPPAGDVIVEALGHISGSNFNITYLAEVDAKTGVFEFKQVAQGSYNVASILGTISGTTFTPDPNYSGGVLVDQNNQPITITTVPLCGIDLGTITFSITQSTPAGIGLAFISDRPFALTNNAATTRQQLIAWHKQMRAAIAHR